MQDYALTAVQWLQEAICMYKPCSKYNEPVEALPQMEHKN